MLELTNPLQEASGLEPSLIREITKIIDSSDLESFITNIIKKPKIISKSDREELDKLKKKIENNGDKHYNNLILSKKGLKEDENNAPTLNRLLIKGDAKLTLYYNGLDHASIKIKNLLLFKEEGAITAYSPNWRGYLDLYPKAIGPRKRIVEVRDSNKGIKLRINVYVAKDYLIKMPNNAVAKLVTGSWSKVYTDNGLFKGSETSLESYIQELIKDGSDKRLFIKGNPRVDFKVNGKLVAINGKERLIGSSLMRTCLEDIMIKNDGGLIIKSMSSDYELLVGPRYDRRADNSLIKVGKKRKGFKISFMVLEGKTKDTNNYAEIEISPRARVYAVKT